MTLFVHKLAFYSVDFYSQLKYQTLHFFVIRSLVLFQLLILIPILSKELLDFHNRIWFPIDMQTVQNHITPCHMVFTNIYINLVLAFQSEQLLHLLILESEHIIIDFYFLHSYLYFLLFIVQYQLSF